MASLGRTIIHELLHVGSSMSHNYTHYEMFRAAYAVAKTDHYFTLGKKPGPEDPKGRNIEDAYSFDDLLFQACRVR